MTTIASSSTLSMASMTSASPQKAKRLRVVFAGTPEFAAISLVALINQQAALNIEIVAVYTQPDRKAGRGQKMTVSAVKQAALSYHISIEQPVTFKKSSVEGGVARQVLRDYQPDIMIVAAYGLILPIGVLTTPTYGCLNIHASLLPRWRGAAPIHRALLAGDAKTGITIMQMDKGLDTGNMLYQVSCTIESEDTAASLHDKLATLGAKAIVTVIQDLARYQAKAIAQDDRQATYAKKLIKTEGAIDWAQSATLIERQVRGLTPWPGAYTFLDGQRVKILASLPVDQTFQTNKPVGTVTRVERTAVHIACGQDTPLDVTSPAHTASGITPTLNSILSVSILQFAGSKPMTAEQIGHGHQLNEGDQFGNESVNADEG